MKIVFGILVFMVLSNLCVAQDTVDYKSRNTGDDLLYFADVGDLLGVKYSILRHKIKVDYANEDSVTALMLASQAGYNSIVEFLISEHADVNKKSDYYNINPLISAVKNDYLETAQILIRNGAVIDDFDLWGRTALHYAVIYDFLATADMLIYYDANIQVKDILGNTPLYYAVYNKSDSLTNLLLKHNADFRDVNNEKSNLLHISAYNGNINFIKSYCGLFSDKSALNIDSLSALELAIIGGQSQILQYFIDSGAEIRDTINGIYTPRTLAKSSHDFKTKKIIRKLKIKDIHYPYFRRIGFGYEMVFNSNEFFQTISVGVSEDRYGFCGDIGLMFRGYEREILLPSAPNEFYQLRESRHGLYLNITKDFKLFNIGTNAYFSVYPKMRTVIMWGKYDGMTIGVSREIVPAPGCGIAINANDSFRFFFAYEYLDMKIENISPNKYSIGVKVLFDFRENSTNEKYKYIINF